MSVSHETHYNLISKSEGISLIKYDMSNELQRLSLSDKIDKCGTYCLYTHNLNWFQIENYNSDIQTECSCLQSNTDKEINLSMFDTYNLDSLVGKSIIVPLEDIKIENNDSKNRLKRIFTVILIILLLSFSAFIYRKYIDPLNKN
jgi:hypothetical protein